MHASLPQIFKEIDLKIIYFTCRESVESLMDRGDAAHEEDDRNVADLLLDQIEFANVILLNKVDLVSKAESKRLSTLLKALNPSAKVIETTNSQVNVADVVSTGRFSFEEASRSAGWLQSLQENTPHTPETEEYGISSFVYKARKPFHPERIHNFMNSYFHLQEPDWSDAIADSGRLESAELAQKAIHDASTSTMLALKSLEKLKFANIPELESVKNLLDASLEALDGAGKEFKSVEDKVKEVDIFAQNVSKPRISSSSKGFSLLKETFGNILRSKGFIWLASRPDLCGEWSQAGAVMRFTVGGPWYASLPEEAWPAEDEAKNDIMRDFEGPCGDRRQELVFIGIDMDTAKIQTALTDCLLKDDELHATIKDPFAVWPALDDLLDGGDDSDSNNDECVHHEHEEETCGVQHEDLFMRPGKMIDITDGACEAQEILDSIKPGTTVIFYWDAEWHDEGREISREMRQIISDLDAFIVRVDIGTHPANWSFAMEKVMSKPEARRPGAKPVLKNGQKWPCFTVHSSPDLQPVDTIAGAHAVKSIKKILASLPRTNPSQIIKRTSSNESNDILDPQGTNGSQDKHIYIDEVASKFPQLQNGAVELREHLKTFSQSHKSLSILWVEDSIPLKVLKGLQEILYKRPDTDSLYIANIQHSGGNASLGKALGVKKPPSLLVFSSMKMQKKVDGPEKVTEALAQEFRTLPAAVSGLNPRPSTKISKQSIDAQGSLYDPPQGKQNRSGATKLTPDGKLVHYFPHMPCLKCGNPWWSSDEWDANCIRCRWDCLKGGYDDNSKPLPEHKAVWAKYVESIKAGITPAWRGKPS